MPSYTSIERFYEVLDYLFSNGVIKKKSDLANDFNISPSKLSEILKKRMRPSIELFTVLINKYDVNPDWLLTGNGPKFIEKHSKSSNQLAHKPEVTYQIKQHDKYRGIPLIPVDAFAGIGSGDVQIKDYAIEDNYVVPDFEKVDFLIRVKGSSMIPTYNSGDIVACREIYDRSVIQWGKIYVLHDKENGTLIKRLFPSESKSKILCRSDNSKHYPDFEVKLKNITNIALVVGGIKIE